MSEKQSSTLPLTNSPSGTTSAPSKKKFPVVAFFGFLIVTTFMNAMLRPVTGPWLERMSNRLETWISGVETKVAAFERKLDGAEERNDDRDEEYGQRQVLIEVAEDKEKGEGPAKKEKGILKGWEKGVEAWARELKGKVEGWERDMEQRLQGAKKGEEK